MLGRKKVHKTSLFTGLSQNCIAASRFSSRTGGPGPSYRRWPTIRCWRVVRRSFFLSPHSTQKSSLSAFIVASTSAASKKYKKHPGSLGVCVGGGGWACRRGNVKLSHEKKGVGGGLFWGGGRRAISGSPPSMSKEWRGPKIGTLLPWGEGGVISILFFFYEKEKRLIPKINRSI